MSNELVDFITNGLSGVCPNEVVIFIISMIPILELRGGLVAASLLHVPMYEAIVICIIGNMLPIPFILLFIKKILGWMSHRKHMGKVVKALETRSKSKSKQIENYKFFGLLFFVGIPLPGTGAWTGALISSLLGMDVKKAFIAILGGVVMASVIMVVIAYGIPALWKVCF